MAQPPEELYVLPDGSGVQGEPVLLLALDGFIDAGSARRLAREHLRSALGSSVVATFDVDQLLDYRARRPTLLFDRDHWADYDVPRLDLHVLHDRAGTQFLLLDGPEPDVQWERFAAAVSSLVERLGVRLTVGLDAIPFAVPHTRPLGVTVHGSRPELVEGYTPWLEQVQVPGSASHVVEYRLGQAGHDAMGFAVHVPQYLAQSEFPAASAVLLSAVGRATGLDLPEDGLREAGNLARVEIDEQVARSEEIAAVVRGLEQRYDAVVSAQGRTTLLGEEATRLPTAEEIGDEFERFLAEQPDSGPADD